MHLLPPIIWYPGFHPGPPFPSGGSPLVIVGMFAAVWAFGLLLQRMR